MKEIKCENCGSSNLKLYAGKYTCAHCGSVFAAEYSDSVASDQHRHFEIENDVVIRYFGFDRIVEIPDGITRVEKGAFDYKTIRTLRCPASLTKFEGTLENTDELQTFEAPGLKKIPRSFFAYNKTIKKVVLENVREIPECAFLHCSALEEVIVPKATIIGEAAFKGSGVRNLNAPEIKEVQADGFCNCYRLKEIRFPVLECIGDSGFFNCDNLKSVVLPRVKSVGAEAFGDCDNLEHIEAPQLEILGDRALYACDSLEKVALPNAQSIDEYAFAECAVLTEVICENATLIANEQGNYNQFVDCPKLDTIKLKEMPPAKRIQVGPEGKQTRASNQSKLSNAEGKMRFCGIMGLTPYTFFCGIFALCFVGKAKEENGGSLSKKAKRYLLMGVVGFFVWFLALAILLASIA